jgi:hypothetical protein
MGRLTALLFTATLLALSARADVITISVSCMVDGVEVTGDASCSVVSGDFLASASASFNYSGLVAGVDARASVDILFGIHQTTAMLDANFMLTTAGPVRQGVAQIQLSQDSDGSGAVQMVSASIGPYRFGCLLGETCTNFETVPFTLGEPFDVVLHQFEATSSLHFGSGAASIQFLTLRLFEGPPSGVFVPIELAAPEPNTGWQLAAGLTCALILARAKQRLSSRAGR